MEHEVTPAFLGLLETLLIFKTLSWFLCTISFTFIKYTEKFTEMYKVFDSHPTSQFQKRLFHFVFYNVIIIF